MAMIQKVLFRSDDFPPDSFIYSVDREVHQAINHAVSTTDHPIFWNPYQTGWYEIGPRRQHLFVVTVDEVNLPEVVRLILATMPQMHYYLAA